MGFANGITYFYSRLYVNLVFIIALWELEKYPISCQHPHRNLSRRRTLLFVTVNKPQNHFYNK